MAKKNILIIAIIILVVAGLIFFLTQKSKPVLKPESPAVEEEESGKTESPEAEQIVLVNSEIALKERLTLQARFFIERYGTYSSDSNYNNWRALKNQMTQFLFNEVIKKIDLEKQNQTEFYSLTTKVTNIDLTEFDQEKNIVFSVQVQEKEIKSGQTKITPKDIELIFVKDGDDWKIDKIEIKK